ncbi:hypothetical protein FRAAL2656 [Frankia alni ACN14a]|uniref:Uncharacterized protein n=1 Tax=Frankia alni (strain DSM 45986 / CECT 9034 / ACN14a) TaxID=326424 RepID=Q0RME9_FRAAA|nr:hypothetical protein FRAAL2656 [Frankia alni ACN14a]
MTTYTPREYSYLTLERFEQDAYRLVCRVAGVPATTTGYGLLHLTDASETRWTAISEDLIYVGLLAALHPVGRAGLEIPANKFALIRRGWPDEWATPPARRSR